MTMIGKKVGKLLVQRTEKVRLKSNGNNTYYRCLCDCGNSVVVSASNLFGKRVLSCGCIRRGAKGRLPKLIQYQGKTYTSFEFSDLIGKGKNNILKLLREGKTPEEVAKPKQISPRTIIAKQYGRTRQWVSLMIKKGYRIEEENGEFSLKK